MKSYPVHKLAKIAGVSIRTLHHYDKIGLLVPATRTDAGYRLYGEEELLRLQQILFYKEMDLSLQEIAAILDEDDFDTLEALKQHKLSILKERERLTTLLNTIDKTIQQLKGEKTMLTNEELYKGFPKEKAEAYRKEAIEKWGEETITHAENSLKKMGKEKLKQVQIRGTEIWQELSTLKDKDAASNEVQKLVAEHYLFIQTMWGKAADDPCMPEAYKGLGQLYVDDARYTTIDGKHDPDFAVFMKKAMDIFVAQI